MLGDPSCAATEVSLQLSPQLFWEARSRTVTCAVRDTGSALYVMRLGEPGNQYVPLGGVLTGNPSCASTPLEVVTCGVRGTDGNLYLIDVNPLTGATTTYDRQTMVMATDPVCVTFDIAVPRLATLSEIPNNVACAVVDVNNQLSTVASVRPAGF
jgi:hypothetical protein